VDVEDGEGREELLSIVVEENAEPTHCYPVVRTAGNVEETDGEGRKKERGLDGRRPVKIGEGRVDDVCQHDDKLRTCLVNHHPKVLDGVGQRSLGGNQLNVVDLSHETGVDVVALGVEDGHAPLVKR